MKILNDMIDQAGISHVLVVDINKQNLDAAFLLPNYLYGLTVTLCDNPVKAWHAMAENPKKFDLVLTDNNMHEPGDGIKLFELATGYGLHSMMLLGPTINRSRTDALTPCLVSKSWFAGKHHTTIWYEALGHLMAPIQETQKKLAREKFLTILAHAKTRARETEYCPGLATKRGRRYTKFLHLPEWV